MPITAKGQITITEESVVNPNLFKTTFCYKKMLGDWVATGGLGFDADDILPTGTHYYKISGVREGSTSAGLIRLSTNKGLEENLKNGQTYTMSVYVRGVGTGSMFLNCGSGGSKTFTLTSDWQRITRTFTANTDTIDSNHYIELWRFSTGSTASNFIHITKAKLEEGEIATDWCRSEYEKAPHVEFDADKLVIDGVPSENTIKGNPGDIFVPKFDSNGKLAWDRKPASTTDAIPPQDITIRPNILVGTNQGDTNWDYSISAGGAVVKSALNNAVRFYCQTPATSGSSYWNVVHYAIGEQSKKLKAGVKYCLSFSYRTNRKPASGNLKPSFTIKKSNGQNALANTQTVELVSDGAWHSAYVVLTVISSIPEDTPFADEKIYISSINYVGNLDFCDLKLEEGETPTPWCIAEEEKKGNDGETTFVSYAFIRTNSKLTSAPTGGTFASPIPMTTVNGVSWSDGIPDGDNTLWVSKRTFSTNSAKQDSTWSKPSIAADGNGLDICFSSQTSQPDASTLPTAGANGENSTWHNTATSADIWMASSIKKDGTWQPWQIAKIKGEKGDSATSVYLTNEMDAIAVGDDNKPLAASTTLKTTIKVFSGSTPQTITNISFTGVTSGITASQDATKGECTFTVTNTNALSSRTDITITATVGSVQYSKVFTLSAIKSVAGASAVSYRVRPSSLTVKIAKTGAANPSTLYAYKESKTGNAQIWSASDIGKIYYSTDGKATWTEYTSGINDYGTFSDITFRWVKDNGSASTVADVIDEQTTQIIRESTDGIRANLLKNSYLKEQNCIGLSTDSTAKDWTSATGTFEGAGMYGSYKAFKVEHKSGTQEVIRTKTTIGLEQPLVPQHTYTLSLYMKGTGKGTICASGNAFVANKTVYFDLTKTNGTVWQRCVLTFTISDNFAGLSGGAYQNGFGYIDILRFDTSSANSYIAIACPKIEEGDSATDWCLSDSDKKGQNGTNGRNGYTIMPQWNGNKLEWKPVEITGEPTASDMPASIDVIPSFESTADGLDVKLGDNSVGSLKNGNNGTDSIIAFLTNEMDSISVGADGKPVASSTTLTTTLKVYKGTTPISFTSLEASNNPGTKSCTASTGVCTFTITNSAALNSKYDVTITGTTQYGTFSKVFTINALKNVAGQSAVMYRVYPNASSIKISKSGTASPSSLTAVRQSKTGDAKTWSSSSSVGSLWYSTDGGTNWTAYSNINTFGTFSAITFRWVNGTTQTDAIIDEQSVPIIREASDGTRANLLKDSYWKNKPAITQANGYKKMGGWVIYHSGDVQWLADTFNGCPILNCKNSGSTSKSMTLSVSGFIESPIEVGKKYTASIWVKGSGKTNMCIGTTSPNVVYSETITLSSTWKRLSATCEADTTSLNIWFARSVDTNALDIQLTQPKLEEGDSATDWCMSETDKKGAKGDAGANGWTIVPQWNNKKLGFIKQQIATGTEPTVPEAIDVIPNIGNADDKSGVEIQIGSGTKYKINHGVSPTVSTATGGGIAITDAAGNQKVINVTKSGGTVTLNVGGLTQTISDGRDGATGARANLLKNSYFKNKSISGWTNWMTDGDSDVSSANTTFEGTFGNNYPVVKGTYSRRNRNLAMYSVGGNIESVFVPGTTYTLSVWMKGSGTTNIILSTNESSNSANKSITLSSAWKRYSVTLATSSSSTSLSLYMGGNPNGSSITVYMACPKLEEGDTMTDWCMSETDKQGAKGDQGDPGTSVTAETDGNGNIVIKSNGTQVGKVDIQACVKAAANANDKAIAANNAAIAATAAKEEIIAAKDNGEFNGRDGKDAPNILNTNPNLYGYGCKLEYSTTEPASSEHSASNDNSDSIPDSMVVHTSSGLAYRSAKTVNTQYISVFFDTAGNSLRSGRYGLSGKLKVILNKSLPWPSDSSPLVFVKMTGTSRTISTNSTNTPNTTFTLLKDNSVTDNNEYSCEFECKYDMSDGFVHPYFALYKASQALTFEVSDLKWEVLDDNKDFDKLECTPFLGLADNDEPACPNLLKNTASMDDTTYWKFNPSDGHLGAAIKEKIHGHTIFKSDSFASTSGYNNVLSRKLIDDDGEKILLPQHWYTISYWLKVFGNEKQYTKEDSFVKVFYHEGIGYDLGNSSVIRVKDGVPTTSDPNPGNLAEWTFHTYTFYTRDDIQTNAKTPFVNFQLNFGTRTSKYKYFEIAGIKLERGDHATTYCEHPDDPIHLGSRIVIKNGVIALKDSADDDTWTAIHPGGLVINSHPQGGSQHQVEITSSSICGASSGNCPKDPNSSPGGLDMNNLNTGGSNFVPISSDIRLKDKLSDIELSPDQIAAAPIFDFQFKQDVGDRPLHSGTSAQYWQEILPNVIRNDKQGFLTMEYAQAALISVVSLAREVARLKAEIEQLKREKSC